MWSNASVIHLVQLYVHVYDKVNQAGTCKCIANVRAWIDYLAQENLEVLYFLICPKITTRTIVFNTITSSTTVNSLSNSKSNSKLNVLFPIVDCILHQTSHTYLINSLNPHFHTNKGTKTTS